MYHVCAQGVERMINVKNKEKVFVLGFTLFDYYYAITIQQYVTKLHCYDSCKRICTDRSFAEQCCKIVSIYSNNSSTILQCSQ